MDIGWTRNGYGYGGLMEGRRRTGGGWIENGQRTDNGWMDLDGGLTENGQRLDGGWISRMDNEDIF